MANGATAREARSVAGQAATLRLALLVPPRLAGAERVRRGVNLGAEEAIRTGSLLGRALELRAVEPERAHALVREWRPAGLIGGFDEGSVRTGGMLGEAAGIAFVNIGSRADSLRGEQCGGAVFHVEASESMFAAALEAAGDIPADARVALWHPRLERFGAAQLNDRFRVRYGSEMDGPAWAGWMAVKILWEASLRTRSTEPSDLLTYLASEGTRFDGHKGWPLSFRPWDHQLRQPLYLVNGAAGAARLLGEVPTRTATEESSSSELLDGLGTPDTTSACRDVRRSTR